MDVQLDAEKSKYGLGLHFPAQPVGNIATANEALSGHRRVLCHANGTLLAGHRVLAWVRHGVGFAVMAHDAFLCRRRGRHALGSFSLLGSVCGFCRIHRAFFGAGSLGEFEHGVKIGSKTRPSVACRQTTSPTYSVATLQNRIATFDEHRSYQVNIEKFRAVAHSWYDYLPYFLALTTLTSDLLIQPFLHLFLVLLLVLAFLFFPALSRFLCESSSVFRAQHCVERKVLPPTRACVLCIACTTAK